MDTLDFSIHDTKVIKEAEKLVKEGWDVLIDIKGSKRPPKIGNYIPDIYATKGQLELVIEIETWKSMFHPHSKAQVAAFRDWESISFLRTRTFRQIIG